MRNSQLALFNSKSMSWIELANWNSQLAHFNSQLATCNSNSQLELATRTRNSNSQLATRRIPWPALCERVEAKKLHSRRRQSNYSFLIFTLLPDFSLPFHISFFFDFFFARDGTLYMYKLPYRQCPLVILNHHISEICKSSSFHLRNIGLIRKYLTNNATEQLVHAFVTSRLDMWNSLLYGLPALQIKRLSRLQNIAARIITRTKPTEHITPVLRDLHWLRVKDRIIFKILIYVYRSTINMSPLYISNLLTPYKQQRQLRSNSKILFTEPRFTKSCGARSFLCAAPRLWNKLPEYVKTAKSVDSSKHCLRLVWTMEFFMFTIF